MNIYEQIERNQFYTIKDLAKILGVDPKTVKADITSGDLRAFRLGHHSYRIHGADAVRYLEGRAV